MLTIVIILTIFWTFAVTPNTIGGQEEKALLIFYKIEEIAHNRDNILHDIGKEHFKIWETEFHSIEENFHKTDDLVQKFKRAQQLDSLIEWQNWFTTLRGYITQTEENTFKQLEAEFDGLYNKPVAVNRTGKSEMFKQQALIIFDQLQQIAQKRDKIIQILWSGGFYGWNVSYQDYASGFAMTNNIEEKYLLSQKMSNLIYRQDEYFKHEGYVGTGKYITNQEEKIYQQTQDAFNALQ